MRLLLIFAMLCMVFITSQQGLCFLLALAGAYARLNSRLVPISPYANGRIDDGVADGAREHADAQSNHLQQQPHAWLGEAQSWGPVQRRI